MTNELRVIPPNNPGQPPSAVGRRRSLARLITPRYWAYGLFWSWNLIFLAFMLLGFAPLVLPEMITAVRADQFPAAFLVYAVLLVLIPVIAAVLGLTLLRRSPGRLFALGYGIEGPLMLLLALRFFVVRELTPAVTLLLVIAGLGILTYLWQLLDPAIDRRGPGWPVLSTTCRLRGSGTVRMDGSQGVAILRTIGLTLLLLTGLYAGAWLAFYALPVAAAGWEAVGEMLKGFWRALGELTWADLLTISWRWLPFTVLGFLLLAYTATLFVLMPIAVVILYTRAWWQGLVAFAARYGRPLAAGVTVVTVVVCAGLFVPANRQPQGLAFALLDSPPTSPAEAQALLDRQEAIRAGLLNAYLAPQRYMSAVGEVRHISEIYRQTLGVSPELADRVEALYEVVARPVLYVPAVSRSTKADGQALQEEPRRAAELYEEFFDRPIFDGERETIVRAVRSTWSIEQAQTAWLAVDDREILLTRQEVSITEHGDWADVELYEVYQNQTGQRQEVIYYFNLPESAVITGVWLGNSPDRAERFAYQVAPRGAAQAVYRREVRRNLDPALLEQIGPRQYRLRVFPVEPMRVTWASDRTSSTIRTGPPLYMWLTYRVLAQASGWSLPRLAEKRNVYWDKTSVRLVNGQPLNANDSTWLPAAVPAAGSLGPVAHRVDFQGGRTVVARPVSPADLPGPPTGLRLAVVLDRSRTMAPLAAEVQAALARLNQAADPAAADIYLTASSYRWEAPACFSLAGFDPGGVLYFGGQNAAALLAQFSELRATCTLHHLPSSRQQDDPDGRVAGSDRAYDAIFVLTDGSGYELGDGGATLDVPDAPVWLISLGDTLPLGYDDATLAALQASGGGVASSVDEALTRLALARDGAADVVDGYAWSVLPAGAVENTGLANAGPDDGFTALAARRLILAEMQRQRGTLDQTETLDYLHAIAVGHSIVTPYSSMIVLVRDDQQKLLDQMEQQGDRFEREVEDVGETAPDPFNVTGVPEPEEWLLLALAVGLLAWYTYRQRVALA